jgi:type II secretory pathway pseudopilin PulG
MKIAHRPIARIVSGRCQRARRPRQAAFERLAGTAGFSLIEMLISVGIMTAIMGATMMSLAQASKANETALLVTAMNNTLRTGMDLVIRDMLQVGSGMPPGHYTLMPSGSGSRMNLPGPPGTAYKSVLGDLELNAVNPGTGLGPLVNQVAATACTVAGPTCAATDMLTVLAADSTFTHVQLVSRLANGTTIRVDPAVNIGTGPDRVTAGQLIMLEKGSYAILVQVTDIDATTNTIFFTPHDSLNLNVHSAPAGSMGLPATAGNCAVATGMTAALPCPDIAPVAPATFLNTVATRVRMISYYLDNTDLARPKLVRRINNGHPMTFDNNSGNTVAFDIDNMQISFDLADGVNNWAGVKFTAADLNATAGGRCLPAACSVNQVRKVNITLSARSRTPFSASKKYFRNSLTTQVSLRGMAFVNDYVQ